MILMLVSAVCMGLLNKDYANSLHMLMTHESILTQYTHV